jgi:hypothetical protein
MSEEVTDSQSTDVDQIDQTEVTKTKQDELNPNDLVAKKIIDENKKYRSRARTAEQKLEDANKRLADIERDRLEKEGKFKEASEFYKKEADGWKEKFEQATGSYAETVISSQVRAKAAELGCIDSEALLKLAPMSDLADEVDENFTVKPDAVIEMLKMMQKKSPYLFKKDAPKIEDGAPKEHKAAPPGIEGKSTLDLARMLIANKQ